MNGLTTTSQRLQHLYKLTDVYFNSDLALQIVVNSIIETKNKELIEKYRKLIFKEKGV